MHLTVKLACIVALLVAAQALADIEKGRKITSRDGGGNCIACHAMANGDELPGNLGPALADISRRFPDRDDLRARVWDATAFNPISSMPPFGKHRLLSEEQIDDVVDFLYTL